MSDVAKGTPAHVRIRIQFLKHAMKNSFVMESTIDTLMGLVGDRFDWNVSAHTVMHILVDYALICASMLICPFLWLIV